MKRLIVMSAIAGSGKSRWARLYQEHHENVFIVSSDEIRKELSGVYDDPSHEKEVWEIYHQRLEDYPKQEGDVTVIADSTNIINEYRKNASKTPGYDEKYLVLVMKDLDIVFKQNKSRDPAKFVPEDAITRMHDRWEEVDEETAKCFDKVVYVKGWFDEAKL